MLTLRTTGWRLTAAAGWVTAALASDAALNGLTPSELFCVLGVEAYFVFMGVVAYTVVREACR